MLVGRDRQRSERPAVKRLFERDDLGACLSDGEPVPARELQARLDRFRTAVAEKRPRQARERRELLGELSLQRVMEQVRGVQKRTRLVGNGRGESRMSMAERGDANARQQVEIFAPL